MDKILFIDQKLLYDAHTPSSPLLFFYYHFLTFFFSQLFSLILILILFLTHSNNFISVTCLRSVSRLKKRKKKHDSFIFEWLKWMRERERERFCERSNLRFFSKNKIVKKKKRFRRHSLIFSFAILVWFNSNGGQDEGVKVETTEQKKAQYVHACVRVCACVKNA